MEGKGVAPVKDKKLDNLCDEFVDLRDQRAKITEKLRETEIKILDRMSEIGITKHRFADQIAEIKEGKDHVKCKTVKNDGDGDNDGDDQDN